MKSGNSLEHATESPLENAINSRIIVIIVIVVIVVIIVIVVIVVIVAESPR